MSGAHDAHHVHDHVHKTGHGHAHDHGHDHSHPHVHAAAEVDDGHTVAPLAESERYELSDLFPDEAPENRHFVMVAGTVIFVVLLVLALAYPFMYA